MLWTFLSYKRSLLILIGTTELGEAAHILSVVVLVDVLVGAGPDIRHLQGASGEVDLRVAISSRGASALVCRDQLLE